MVFCGAEGTSRHKTLDLNDSAASLPALLDQAKSVYENEVAVLKAEVNALKAEVAWFGSDLQPSSPIAIQSWGCSGASSTRPSQKWGEVLEVSNGSATTEPSLLIDGATGPFAKVLNGSYMTLRQGYNSCRVWRKQEDSNVGEVWLLRFSNGRWAVTNSSRKAKDDCGGWMISCDVGKLHPSECSGWEVNMGKSWETQYKVKATVQQVSARLAAAPSYNHLGSTDSIRSQGRSAKGNGMKGNNESYANGNGTGSVASASASLNPVVNTASKDTKTTSHSHKVIYNTEAREAGNKLEEIARHPMFETFFVCVILFNAVIIALEVEYSGMDLGYDYGLHDLYTTPASENWPGASNVFKRLDWGCGILFAFEFVFKLIAMRCAFFKDLFHYLDAVMVLFWFIGIAAIDFGVNTNIARMIRIVKLGRLARLVRTLQGFDALFVMTTAIKGSVSILGWAFLVLFAAQSFIALLLFQLLQETYFTNTSKPIEERQEIFMYFGTFTRAMFSMFELTLANWPPLCRALAEYVNEWFMTFGILYKLIIGFAVVGVVNGVFMQETFKVASRDDTIMVREKMRQMHAHKRKISRLFAAADQDGAGQITKEEFRDVLSDPDIHTWLASMELDSSDVDTLFMLLDHSGDGEITSDELLKGVAKLKGTARSIDVAKIAKHMEQLMEHSGLEIDGHRDPVAEDAPLALDDWEV